MSGGVDSAVATARLLAAGHQVTGVHLRLANSELAQRTGRAAGCASPTEVVDAQRVADQLGVELLVWDFSDRFADQVVSYFLAEYEAGRTPNPCLRCNQTIKFAALLDRGLELGFDAVATGHYARLVAGERGTELWRATDPSKDQSYVLGVLSQHQLRHSIFPLGESLKSEVRAEAAGLGIVVANKPDSSDICFIRDGDTAGYLADKLGEAPGEIVDLAGNRLGAHSGTFRYTIGQRKGLNLGVPSVDGRPRYVVGLDPVARQVTLGGADDLMVDVIRGIQPSWTSDPRPGPWRGLVQVRAHGEPMPATIAAEGDQIVLRLDAGCRGVAPGQYAVCYDGDRVVGSAVIASAAHRKPGASA